MGIREKVLEYFKDHECDAISEDTEELFLFFLRMDFDTFSNIIQVALEKNEDDKGLRVLSVNMNFDQGYVLSGELLKALNDFTVHSLFYSASVTPENVIVVSACVLVNEDNITNVIDELLEHLISDPSNSLYNLNKVLNFEYDEE